MTEEILGAAWSAHSVCGFEATGRQPASDRTDHDVRRRWYPLPDVSGNSAEGRAQQHVVPTDGGTNWVLCWCPGNRINRLG